MSDSQRWPHAKACLVASELLHGLKPCCQVIAVAGSIRRLRPMVKDIELVFVPSVMNLPAGLFAEDTSQVDLASRDIERWLAQGIIKKRLAVTGKPSSWGLINKHAVHVETGIAIDFFCEPDVLDWPRTLCIRTGPKTYNVRLMTEAPKHGIQAHAYGKALFKVGTGERIIAKDEREFIELCGLKYLPPEKRT